MVSAATSELKVENLTYTSSDMAKQLSENERKAVSYLRLALQNIKKAYDLSADAQVRVFLVQSYLNLYNYYQHLKYPDYEPRT